MSKEEKKVTEKLENVFPHPSYCQNRIAIIPTNEYQLGEILEYDEYRFKILLDPESGRPSNIREELIAVLGRPFTIKLNLLKEIP